MPFRAFVYVSVFSLALFVSDRANALSCLEPQMSEAVAGHAEAIFEGRGYGDGRDMTEEEKNAAEAAGISTKGGGISDLKVFDFKVIRAWKGAEEGEKISVLYNTYWGDRFFLDVHYLVVTDDLLSENLHHVGLCGNTTRMRYAEERGAIKALEDIFSEISNPKASEEPALKPSE